MPKPVGDSYFTLGLYRFGLQILLALAVAVQVTYQFGLVLLEDDTLLATPLPRALTTLGAWTYAFPTFTILIILFIQFAFTMNRKDFMTVGFFVVYIIYLAVCGLDLGYILKLYIMDCRGAVNLGADPDLGYCSDGTMIRWQWKLVVSCIGVQLAILILIAVIMWFIFKIVKDIPPNEDDESQSTQLAELYSTFGSYHFGVQALLALALAIQVTYQFALILLNDDTLLASPLLRALTTLGAWTYAFPTFTILILLYVQFAISLNRKDCMKPMFLIVFALYIIACGGDLGYILYLYFVKCKGAVNLAATPDLGYCSDGVMIRWQWKFIVSCIAIQFGALIGLAILLTMLLALAKRIKPYINRQYQKGEPLNTIVPSQQVGSRMRLLEESQSKHHKAADMFIVELLGKKFR